MGKLSEIKKNHHYVWSYYLKSLSLDKKNVYYISKKGKVSFDSIKGLAKEVDFYKINKLNFNDLKFLNKLSSNASEDLQKIHNSQLSFFFKLLSVEDIPVDFRLNHEKETLVNIIKSNSLEDTYMIIEKLALKTINEILQENFEFLENEQNLLSLLYFLGHQITRTKSFKIRVLSAMKKDGRLYSYWEKNWWFISYMFGINIGHGLYRSILNKRSKYFFIKNTTSISFITSDNPMINIHHSLDNMRIIKKLRHQIFILL